MATATSKRTTGGFEAFVLSDAAGPTIAKPGQVIYVDGDPREFDVVGALIGPQGDLNIATWRDLAPEQIFDTVQWPFPEPWRPPFDWALCPDFTPRHLVGRGRGREIVL